MKHLPMLHQGFPVYRQSRRGHAADGWSNSRNDEDDEEANFNFINTCLKSSPTGQFLNVIPVTVSSSEGKEVSTFAMLDPCASFHSLADDLAKRLKLRVSAPKSIQVNTIHGRRPLRVRTATAVISGNRRLMTKFELRFQVLESSHVSFSRVPTPKDLDPKILKEMSIRYDVDVPYITVLLGADPRLHRCLESRISDNGLLLTTTELGVAVMGTPTSDPDDEEEHAVNFIGIESYPEINFWDNEVGPTLYDTTKVPSYEDRAAEKIIAESTTRRSDGSYEIRPPWKKIPPIMPSNRAEVRYRFDSLARRFKRDPDYFTKYSSIIKSY